MPKKPLFVVETQFTPCYHDDLPQPLLSADRLSALLQTLKHAVRALQRDNTLFSEEQKQLSAIRKQRKLTPPEKQRHRELRLERELYDLRFEEAQELRAYIDNLQTQEHRPAFFSKPSEPSQNPSSQLPVIHEHKNEANHAVCSHRKGR